MRGDENFVPLIAPAGLSWRRLFLWWAERIESDSARRYTVDLSKLESDQQEAFHQVVSACGHETSLGRPWGLHLTGAKRCLMVETIFADSETNSSTLLRLLTLYRSTLRSLAEQEYVPNCGAVHVTYCSIDKVQEFLSISRLINSLNQSSSLFTFLLVPYIHPKEGYPKRQSGHVDAVRLPNKYYSENAKRLTQKAVNRFRMESNIDFQVTIRAAIDDDDIWLPWAANEILRIAESAIESGGRTTKAIGVTEQLVYYPSGPGRVDMAEWDVAMTGSKFFMARNLEDLKDVTPWMLPESFTSVQERFFRRLSIDLRIAKGVRPFFVYMRSHGNLSGMLKTDHYIGEASSLIGVGSLVDAYRAAISLVERSSRKPSSEDYKFVVDPPSLSVSGIFDSSSGKLEIKGNFSEYLSARGFLENSALRVIVNAGTKNGRVEQVRELEDELVFDAADWDSRPLLRIEDSNGNKVGSAWIRGEAPFLS